MSKRCFIEQVTRLDVREVCRLGRLRDGSVDDLLEVNVESASCGSVSLLLAGQVVGVTWTPRAEGEAVIGWIRIAWEKCGFGGSRAWWLCATCEKRVAHVYAPDLRCRRCTGLSYRSQSESDGMRAVRRANSLRRALGWCRGIIHGQGERPKNMHLITYRRLIGRYIEAERLAAQYLSNGLPKIEGVRRRRGSDSQ